MARGTAQAREHFAARPVRDFSPILSELTTTAETPRYGCARSRRDAAFGHPRTMHTRFQWRGMPPVRPIEDGHDAPTTRQSVKRMIARELYYVLRPARPTENLAAAA